MHNILILFFSALLASFRSSLALQTEILALRQQIIVLKRSTHRPKLRFEDRLLWIWLLRLWTQWRSALVIVKPVTVIAWHRKDFRLFWTWKCRHGKSGRLGIPKDVRELIPTVSKNNSLWGAPRIHGKRIVEIPKVGGLHHRYERRAA